MPLKGIIRRRIKKLIIELFIRSILRLLQKVEWLFFEQLQIQEPQNNLNVGSGTQAEQTANIMIWYEKTTVLRIPYVTLIDNAERTETFTIVTDELIGTRMEAIRPAFEILNSGNWKKGATREKWDRKTVERVVKSKFKRLL